MDLVCTAQLRGEIGLLAYPSKAICLVKKNGAAMVKLPSVVLSCCMQSKDALEEFTQLVEVVILIGQDL